MTRIPINSPYSNVYEYMFARWGNFQKVYSEGFGTFGSQSDWKRSEDKLFTEVEAMNILIEWSKKSYSPTLQSVWEIE